VALLAGGIGGFMLWSGQRQAHDESVAASAAYDAAHERHAVVFKVDAAEYSDATATKIPVHVAGSDVDGAAVDEDAYVDAEGRGVELAEGIYAITVVTSPLTSDGTVYDVPTTSWDVTIGTDAGAGADVDATSQPIALSPVSDYTAVSDETIQRMYDYASKSGTDQATVDSYKGATTSRIQAAKDQKAADEAAAAEAQRQAEEAAKKAALHYENEYFSLEVPESWRDNYTATEGSGHASTQGAGASSGTSTKSYGFESSVKATLGAAWGSTPANEVFEIDVAPSSAGTSLWFTGNDPGEYIGTTSSGYTVWYRTSIKFEDHEDFDYVRNSITLK